MPEWAHDLIAQVGWPAFFILAVALSLWIAFTRFFWPFWLAELWPEIKEQRRHNRALQLSQEVQLKALYDVLIKSTSDSATTNLRVESALQNVVKEFEKQMANLIAVVDELIASYKMLVPPVSPFTDTNNPRRRRDDSSEDYGGL